MLLAPWLDLVHAAYIEISLAVAAIRPVRSGFGFIRGLIDLVLSWVNPMAQNPWITFVVGAARLRSTSSCFAELSCTSA